MFDFWLAFVWVAFGWQRYIVSKKKFLLLLGCPAKALFLGGPPVKSGWQDISWGCKSAFSRMVTKLEITIHQTNVEPET